jgi:hypothetical protein
MKMRSFLLFNKQHAKGTCVAVEVQFHALITQMLDGKVM